MRLMPVLLLSFVLAGLTSACGQRGPLYLPDETASIGRAGGGR